MSARKTLPTGSTLLQGRPYVPAAATDVAETFRLAREGRLGQSEFVQVVDQYAKHHTPQYARRIAFGVTFAGQPF